MECPRTKLGSDLFIVDNSDDDWKVVDYLPFEVYAKALQEYFRNHEVTAGEWEQSQSVMFPILDQYQRDGYGSCALFDALSTLGAQLLQWHLLEHSTAIAITATTTPPGVTVPSFFGNDRKLLKVAEKGRSLADPEATAIGPSGKVCINATSGFSGVSQAIWRHTIGGYQVLHKWLDDRRKAGRSLSDDDIAHWRRVHAALEATQTLMGQVDRVIADNGGWPDAFSQAHPPPDPATLAAQPRVKRPRARHVSARQGSLFGNESEVASKT